MTAPTPTERSADRWRQTVHLGYIAEKLVHVSICAGTVSEVARHTLERHAPDARLVCRAYPIGEQDWPTVLVYEATVVLDGTPYHWRHEFRRPDEPWPTAALAVADAIGGGA